SEKGAGARIAPVPFARSGVQQLESGFVIGAGDGRTDMACIDQYRDTGNAAGCIAAQEQQAVAHFFCRHRAATDFGAVFRAEGQPDIVISLCHWRVGGAGEYRVDANALFRQRHRFVADVTVHHLFGEGVGIVDFMRIYPVGLCLPVRLPAKFEHRWDFALPAHAGYRGDHRHGATAAQHFFVDQRFDDVTLSDEVDQHQAARTVSDAGAGKYSVYGGGDLRDGCIDAGLVAQVDLDELFGGIADIRHVHHDHFGAECRRGFGGCSAHARGAADDQNPLAVVTKLFDTHTVLPGWSALIINCGAILI